MSEPTITSLIAELEERVPEVEEYQDVAGILHADLIAGQLKRYADAAILALLKALCEQRTRAAELEADLAKAESQKRGLVRAAKTGMAAGNRMIELEAELTKWKWIARQAAGTPDHECESVDTLLADLADAYDTREQDG